MPKITSEQAVLLLRSAMKAQDETFEKTRAYEGPIMMSNLLREGGWDLDLTDVDFRALEEITYVDFDIKMENVNFSGIKLQDCNFIGVKEPLVLEDCNFYKSMFSRKLSDEVNKNYPIGFFNVIAKNCNFGKSNLVRAQAINFRVEKCNFMGAYTQIVFNGDSMVDKDRISISEDVLDEIIKEYGDVRPMRILNTTIVDSIIFDTVFPVGRVVKDQNICSIESIKAKIEEGCFSEKLLEGLVAQLQENINARKSSIEYKKITEPELNQFSELKNFIIGKLKVAHQPNVTPSAASVSLAQMQEPEGLGHF